MPKKKNSAYTNIERAINGEDLPAGEMTVEVEETIMPLDEEVTV